MQTRSGIFGPGLFFFIGETDTLLFFCTGYPQCTGVLRPDTDVFLEKLFSSGEIFDSRLEMRVFL